MSHYCHVYTNKSNEYQHQHTHQDLLHIPHSIIYWANVRFRAPSPLPASIFPNKLAPYVPRNPPFCSFVSFPSV